MNTIKNKLLYSSFLYFLSVPFAFAAPSIIKVTGISSADEIITVEGSGFSSPTQPVTQLWDTVENISAYSSLANNSEVPTSDGNPWSQNGNPWAKPFLIKSDGSANKYYYGEGKKNFLGWPRIDRSSTPKKIYVSWQYKPGIHPYAESGSNKFMRIWDDGDGVKTRISWTANELYCSDGVNDRQGVWKHWTGKENSWNRHELYVDLDSGELSTWVNNIQNGNLVTCAKAPNYAVPINIYVLGFDHGSNAYQTQKTSIDDIYVSGTLARVEVSNSSTLSSSETRQIQPIESWGNNKISFTFYPGSLNTSLPLYIYVFDEKGVRNNTGVALCSTCPRPPIMFE